ncbi:MAG: hypothetical protein A2W25_05350 [candidate division Zixibacteria bacterium RBG_16_53_22]|nr:MAG: hypothetical protein A2W25_05350 [candidate division Zixibacteria bacterium RBG_16_53_22]
MNRSIPAILTLSLMVFSCSQERPTGMSAERLKGNLKIFIVDSFHLNDSTASFKSAVDYSISHESGYFNNGTHVIDSLSTIGTSYELSLDSIPAGNYSATFSVERPFVILGRKDDTGRARFIEIKTIALPVGSTVALPAVEIWAYRINRLVVYFSPNITFAQADSIVRGAGAGVISRSRSLLENAPLYWISTVNAGTEAELKPVLENWPGVEAVYFELFGHSYY